MATGSQSDIANRLAQVVPPSWFQGSAPNESALLQAFASIMAWCYRLIVFAKTQTRVSTASGFFLDLMALDFFGRNYSRGVAMLDAAFAIGIKKELLRVRATRIGMYQALLDLTGRAPVIFEPTKPSDTGAYGYVMGYGVAGRYGSMLMPFQALITAYRPATSGIPNAAGYGSPSGGYGVGAIEYADQSWTVGPVTDAQIYAKIAAVQSIGTIPWTALSN